MTRRVGRFVVLEPEFPKACEECGKVAELRPYGFGGASICVDCSRTPKHEAACFANFRARLEGVEPREAPK